MARQKKETIIETERDKFREELKDHIKANLDQISHYVSGCKSPFTYSQISIVHDNLREICEVLDISQG